MELETNEIILEADERNTGQNGYKDGTYDIISRVAYLIGVPKRVFEADYESPKLDVYERMDKDKNARIIRHLCVIRTAIERGFKHISEKMKFQYRTILSMPEHIPEESVRQLSADGINFYKKTNTKLNQHVMELNRLISDRINNCRYLFPTWVNWEYVKQLFIMPKGMTEEGTKEAAAIYFANLDCYPYRLYINWTPRPYGNILYNDKKFLEILYQQNNDYFTEHSRVADAGSTVKRNIHDFIAYAKRVVMVVDCENSDPYRLCAAIRGLDEDILSKLRKIMLFDDVHTVDAWRILEGYTNIPVEHLMTERVKQSKSLVDIELTARTCMEHYRNDVDAFILVSSDSDYWGLISSLPDARFLVMVEREKCGPDIKTALTNGGIFYCYIDDFYSGNGEEIKTSALFNEIYRYLAGRVDLNINDMLDAALGATRIEMTSHEKHRFLDKHIRQMKLVIDPEGNVSFELSRK